MDQLKGKSPALMIVVVVVAGVIFYVTGGGPGSSGKDGSTARPSGAIEMSVGRVSYDGTFRGRVEPAGRNARQGMQQFGTDQEVRLRLLDIEPPRRFGAPCWREESQKAIDGLIGSRIWVDPNNIRQQGSGTFTVYAWNRSATFVQEQLLRDGNGRIVGDGVSYPRYRAALVTAEDEADAADRGLWKACGVS